MKALQILVSFLLIPGIFFLIIAFIPEAVRDVKQWKTDLFPKRVRNEKRKTVRSHTGATVCSDSFPYSKYSDNVILSHE